jgi:hypothetical protein
MYMLYIRCTIEIVDGQIGDFRGMEMTGSVSPDNNPTQLRIDLFVDLL